MAYLYSVSISGQTYSFQNRRNETVEFKDLINNQDKDKAVQEILALFVKSKNTSTSEVANAFGLDATKFYNYLIKNNDADHGGTLSAEEIANGIVALDKDTSNKLDGELDIAKLDGTSTNSGHSEANNGHDNSGHTTDASHSSGGVKAPEAKATVNMRKREKVADKDEDQNGWKADLGGRGSWTDYVKDLDKTQGATKDGVVKDAGDVKAMFGLTDAAAEAVFNKAKEFKPNDITDGVGIILKEIDDKAQGGYDKGDGKLTIGEFNDYVEELLKSDPAEETQKKETEKSEKPSKGGGGGGSTSKVEINNPSNTETKALEEKIAALEKEIAELKKHDEKPAEPEKKKGGNKGLLLAGAGILAAGAAFFAIRNRNDQQRYKDQMAQYQQQCGPKPLCPPSQPFYPPQPGFGSPPIGFQGQFQGQLQGPANPTMFA